MPGSRSYNSPTREATAAQTRERIVDAAGRLFVRDGYAATPMRAIADEAVVSIQSVHLAGPKSSLLLAAFERTFAGDEGRHSLLERPEMRAVLAEEDPRQALAAYVAYIAAANRRSAGIWRALAAAADADEVVRAAALDLDTRRRGDVRTGVEQLAERGLIGDIDEAADVLGYLTSATTYEYFVRDSGWSDERYEGWLAASIARLVLRLP